MPLGRNGAGTFGMALISLFDDGGNRNLSKFFVPLFPLLSRLNDGKHADGQAAEATDTS